MTPLSRPIHGSLRREGWRFVVSMAGAWMGLFVLLSPINAHASESRVDARQTGHHAVRVAAQDQTSIETKTKTETKTRKKARHKSKDNTKDGTKDGTKDNTKDSTEEKTQRKRRVRESQLEKWNKASREERREMRAAAGDFWDDATPEERKRIQRRVKSLRKSLPDFSKAERRMILRRTLEMPHENRSALRDRIMKIEELDATAKDELERDLRELIDEQSDEMHRIEKNVNRWQEMSAEERDEMREQARRFKRLSLEDRRRLLDEWVPSEKKAPGESAE